MTDKNTTNTTDFLVVDRRHTSWLVAGAILLLIITFVAGFLWGKRHMVLELQQERADKAFVDKAYFSILSEPQENPGQRPADSEQGQADAAEEVWYQAQLIGFGQLTRAQAFIAKMERQGIAVRLETRKSHNGNKRMVWYQVVTQPTTDRRELELLAQKLKTTERLRNVKIVTAQQQ